MLYDTITITRKLSDNGKSALKQLEGLKLTSYLDSASIWTIGYGSTFIFARKVKVGDSITQQQANHQFDLDIIKFENAVNYLVSVYITQNQFDALVIFVYNVGIKAFSDSTMLRLLNNKKYDEAAEQFDRWVYASGNKVKGLETRRRIEKELFTHDTKLA